MGRLLLLAALGSFLPDVARACDPIDAPVLLAVMGGDFVFVNAERLTRLRADGTVVLTKEDGFVSPRIAVMPDGRHLLNPVPEGDTGMCLGEHVDLRVIDTTTQARSRTLGSFPAHEDREAAVVGRVVSRGSSMDVIVGAMLDGGERWEWERVSVTPTRATRRGRVPTSEAEEQPSSTTTQPPLDRLAPLEAHASPWESEHHWVKVRSGARDLVTIRLARRPLAARFSPDGSHLAIATYEHVNEEHGTGFSARLDLVELSSGRIYYNSRTHCRPGNRRIAWSYDGGETWRDEQEDDELWDGPPDVYGCKAALVRLPYDDRDVLVFSSPGRRDKREDITVWVSFDGGQTWPAKRLVRKGPGNYSWLAAGRNGTPSEGMIYLLAGKDWLARFNLAWILEGNANAGRRSAND